MPKNTPPPICLECRVPQAHAFYASQNRGREFRSYTQAFRGHHDMRAQDAPHFGTDIYPRYHSGWGGPYGDGNYPGTIDENMGPPHWDVGELTIRLKQA